MKKKESIIKILMLTALFICLSGCGGREAVETEAPEPAEESVSEESTEEAGIQEEVIEQEENNIVKEIPVDFSFWSSALREEVDYFSLTLAQLKEPVGEYELRLYNQKGYILQQVSCGVLTEPIEISYGDFDQYPGPPVNDMEIFSSDASEGLYIGWDDVKLRFYEAIKVPKYTEVKDKKMLVVEEGNVCEERKIYQLGKKNEVRRFLLNKNTGELEICDCLDGENLFKGVVLLDKEKKPVNKKYYDFLLWEDIYSTGESMIDNSISIYQKPIEEDGEWEVRYESREALLADFGFEDREPFYQCYDWHRDLLLELYKDEVTGQFLGISYDGYYINTVGEKEASMYGFEIDGAAEMKWPGEDAYSGMTKFQADEQDYVKEYEEFTDYTTDGLPDHFLSQGLVRTEGGEGLTRVMDIDYVYRDDGTLFYREYHHSTLVFPTNDCYLYSFYDEKGRVLYERGYITHGHLEDYYIYEKEGNMPTYHLELDYCHGYVFPHLEKYY